ncbi:hypothetical protein [Methylobacterium thuringiense]|uniref:hypothetical protein n=1 Tax=Methylobacterium thuringiense TaxID=1003091 RepID=UPI001EDE5412|nr:hypothetical protein [Methylobacterium thuringiense]
MTSPPRLSRNQRLRLIIPGVVALLVFLTLAGFGVWQILRSIEAYYISKHSSVIDAEVLSTNRYKMDIYGLIKFSLNDGNVDRECVAKANLGGASNYLKFKPGAIIKIIPQTGCDNPIIITAIRFPIFELMMSLFWIACAFVLAAKFRQAFRL